MKPFVISDRFVLPCPEGFRTLSEKERNRLNMPGGGESLCLTNEDDRIVVSIGWKDVGAVAGLLLHLISPVSSMEATVNRAMAPFGYRRETMLTRQIGGQAARGFRYSYTADGTPMVGESYVIRQGRSLTFFHGYVPEAQVEKGLPQWHALLDAVQPV